MSYAWIWIKVIILVCLIVGFVFGWLFRGLREKHKLLNRVLKLPDDKQGG